MPSAIAGVWRHQTRVGKAMDDFRRMPPQPGQVSRDGASPLEPELDSGRAVRCPFCGGRDTEPFSSFGSQLSTEQHYCRSCRTPFEYMRQEDAASS